MSDDDTELTLPRLAALALFALALAATAAAPFCARDSVTDTNAWLAALREHRAIVRDGDVLLVHPPWRDDVARAIRDAALLPPRVHVTVALAPRAGQTLPPVVVISDVDLDGWRAPLPRALRRLIDDDTERASGDITLVRLRAAPAGLVDAEDDGAGDDGIPDLARARVEVRKADGDVVACPWDALQARHECTGLPEWMHVGVEKLPINGQKRECVWAHPMTNATLVVAFDDVTLAARPELSLALTDGAADNQAGADVTALMRIDGVDAARVTRTKGRRGFASARAVVDGAPRVGDVELHITTPHDGQRHVCFLLRGAR